VIVSRAVHLMEDWNAVNLAHQPELGRSKCNVDASFYKPAGHTGWGWCIRNSQGQFMAAGCNWIREKLTTITVKQCAIRSYTCKAKWSI
jgi:hypothetical protein